MPGEVAKHPEEAHFKEPAVIVPTTGFVVYTGAAAAPVGLPRTESAIAFTNVAVTAPVVAELLRIVLSPVNDVTPPPAPQEPQAGAADTEPVPVCVRHWIVALVVPANRVGAPLAPAYMMSPSVVNKFGMSDWSAAPVQL